MYQSEKIYNKNNVHLIFMIYWCVLIAWQNISSVTNRSGMDVIIKILLITMLTFYFLFHTNGRFNNKLFYLILLIFCLIITFFTKEIVSLGILIAYLFLILFAFLTLLIGEKYEINKKQLILFLNVVIVVVAYMAIYAVLFCTDQFTSALSLTSGYGNELTSFMISNHEYGLYLIGGITSCIICLNLKQTEHLKYKLLYIIALFLFFSNLILTYSRTSLLGMLLIIVVYILFMKNNKLKKFIIIAGISGCVMIILVPEVQSFLYSVVLKENNAAGRDKLYLLAIDFFIEGNIIEKIWGHGITNSRSFFELETTHGSVHNAFLQILVYYGISGFLFMLGVLFSQLYANVKLIKENRFFGVIFIGILFMCISVMFTNTAYIFSSSVDSYFLTIFAIVIPKYVRNSINAGNFYKF